MYYTIRLNQISVKDEPLWDVVKYTSTKQEDLILLMTTKYTYNKSETIKKSLSYKEANNLATILQKLTK